VSGAFSINRPREFDYELRETEVQRRQRAKIIRALYALVDPHGWDARRLSTSYGPHPRSHAR
jgi:hypothetical protein